MTETLDEVYYRTAYEHGAEAFQRGDPLSDCGKHYWEDAFGNRLGVLGWTNGWRDAYRATLEDCWLDDASYAAYQGRG